MANFLVKDRNSCLHITILLNYSDYDEDGSLFYLFYSALAESGYFVLHFFQRLVNMFVAILFSKTFVPWASTFILLLKL